MAELNGTAGPGRMRLSFASDADIDEFVQVLGRFERGEIGPDAWRAFRLVRGTYGQRQAADAQMLRVKVPQGMSVQLRALADVAERYSRGFGHITTRQNLQFHFLELHDVEPAMRHLAGAGLTTREACGNSVRNITPCPYAGVARDELFDVTPFAEALTRYLLRHPLSSTLPRKFKIAFEGCAVDHVMTPINDIGFRARVQTRDGEPARGFRVTAGGGTSTRATTGHLLFDFVAASEILNVAEALLRVFHRLGDYQHKQRNRMKFLIRTLGWEPFCTEVECELDAFRAEGGAHLPFDPAAPPVEHPATPSSQPDAIERIADHVQRQSLTGPGLRPRVAPRLVVLRDDFDRWSATNVRPQKQEGYAAVIVTLPLGDVTTAQMRELAAASEAFGDGTVRVTPEQNLVLRWIANSEVAELHLRLAALGLATPGANTLADVTSCPGAESCRLAVTQSRGLGRALGDLLQARPDLVAAVPGLDIKISGCPNGCGQHHIAGIGFQGSLRKVDGRPAPHYFVMVGGGIGEDARFGRLAATIPARRVTEAVERLVALYRAAAADGETPTAFFQRIDLDAIRGVLAGIDRLTPESARPEDFVDLGDDSAFRPEVMDGECSA